MNERIDKLRRDQSHIDNVVTRLGRLLRRRAKERAFTRISVQFTDGVPTDIMEDRRFRAEDFDPEKL